MGKREPGGNKPDPGRPDEPWQQFGSRVAGKEKRKKRARREGDRTIWLGMGMFGLVGWSIALPTLLGLLVGRWLDSRFGGAMSWTAALMLGGLTLGVLNVWNWIHQSAADDSCEDEPEGKKHT